MKGNKKLYTDYQIRKKLPYPERCHCLDERADFECIT